MRRVSRVNEGVDTSTVSTVWNSVAIMGSLGLSSLGLCSLRLRGRTATELSCVGIALEIQVGWVSWVNERIEVSSLLSRSGRSKLLSLNRSLLKLLLSYRGLLLSNRGLLSDRGLTNRCLTSTRCWRSTRCFTSRSGWRLLRLCSCKIRIKSSRIQSICSLWNMISFENSESIFACSISDGDGFAIVVNVTVLANSFTVSRSFLPEN